MKVTEKVWGYISKVFISLLVFTRTLSDTFCQTAKTESRVFVAGSGHSINGHNEPAGAGDTPASSR